VPFPELVERDGRWIKEQSNGVSHDYTEQRAAVEAMLRLTDQVFALRGVAGAGKTTALKEFHAGVDAAGKSHVLLAPTTKAVRRSSARFRRRRYKQSKRFCSLRKKARSFKTPLLPLMNGDCCPTGPVTHC
jgi:primosomal protein N'